MLRTILICAFVLEQAGCALFTPPLRQSGPAAEAQTRAWLKQIRRRGQDGDWLVIRGYNSSDHLVAFAGNAELSHVGILDATNGAIIEAVTPAVRVVSLEEFLEHADRVQLIRPNTLDRAAGRRALARARTQIGAPYDLLGTIGLPEVNTFYCSELAAWSAGMEVDRDGPGEVLHPADMSRFGVVLLESAPRPRE